MALLLTAALVAIVLVVTGVTLVALLVGCVDPDRRRTMLGDRSALVDRLAAIAPWIGVLAAILLINKGLQGYIVAFSYAYGIDPTATFFAIEGNVVATIQGLFPSWATLYFSAVYVFGYAVLLTFPLVAYVFASSARPLKTLVAAYSINYAVAVVCYTAVRAYGPRTFHEQSGSAESVSHGLVELFPDIVYLTSLVNSQTNVFPSLHTSLSVTVLAVALLTHTEFPRWTPIAALLAVSIVLSTMALGIHWLIDVVAGVGLAGLSVAGAQRVVARRDGSPPIPRPTVDTDRAAETD